MCNKNENVLNIKINLHPFYHQALIPRTCNHAESSKEIHKY